MSSAKEYTVKLVNGVRAIVWDHINSCTSNRSDTKASKKQRRLMKEEIGSQNKDVPMLDVRQYGDKLVYRDIVMCSDDVSMWITAL